eukprot:g76645.t1
MPFPAKAQLLPPADCGTSRFTATLLLIDLSCSGIVMLHELFSQRFMSSFLCRLCEIKVQFAQLKGTQLQSSLETTIGKMQSPA